MTDLERVNIEYFKRIDEMAERFRHEKTYYAKEWLEKLTTPTGEETPPICIWGAGAVGQTYCSSFFSEVGVPVSCFCDNAPEKWGKNIWKSVKCISLTELNSDPCYRIVIAANGHQEQIAAQCISLGIAREDIFIPPVSVLSWTANYRCSVDEEFFNQMIMGAKELITYFGSDNRSKDLLIEMIYRRLLDPYKLMSQDVGDQYFIPEMPVRTEEAFVDAGAYTGDTLLEFADHAPFDTHKLQYYAFECDAQNYKELQQQAQRLNKFSIKTYPIALWSKKSTLQFSGGNASGVVIAEIGDSVQADRLDDILIGKRVTWIKMDIEGAEMQALAGCASIIKNYKPRLAICVYHKVEDIFRIPQYIKTLREDYQFLLRHHSAWDFETVLYAY